MQNSSPADKTVSTYENNFETYLQKTTDEIDGDFKVWMDEFLTHIPKGGSVFELGSATGRDADYMTRLGFQVHCTDVSTKALNFLKDKGYQAVSYDFRDNPHSEWLAKFDGVFENAVLLHAEPTVFEIALKNLLTLLKSEGVFAFSVKAGEGEEVTSEKMDSPRYFKYYTIEELKNILESLNCEILKLQKDGSGKWIQVIVRKV